VFATRQLHPTVPKMLTIAAGEPGMRHALRVDK
jgi:hypothetical protein